MALPSATDLARLVADRKQGRADAAELVAWKAGLMPNCDLLADMENAVDACEVFGE